jgi:hypothetical protein
MVTAKPAALRDIRLEDEVWHEGRRLSSGFHRLHRLADCGQFFGIVAQAGEQGGIRSHPDRGGVAKAGIG